MAVGGFEDEVAEFFNGRLVFAIEHKAERQPIGDFGEEGALGEGFDEGFVIGPGFGVEAHLKAGIGHEVGGFLFVFALWIRLEEVA